MKILVTGGAGYIGSITTQILCDSQHNVVVFDNLERGYSQAVDKRAKFIQGDLRNKQDIFKALDYEKPDTVIHFAAYIEVGESMIKPNEFFENNVMGSLNLIKAMNETGCKKIIFSSTCATYGTPDKIPMDESLKQRPESVYGESKLISEKIFSWAKEIHNIDYVFLRYFNACGATDIYGEAHNPETHLIPLILQVAQGKRNEIKLFGDDYPTRDGTCIRDYIHVKDIAQAHILALKTNISGVYNLGNGEGYTVKEVIDVCRKITNHPIPVSIKPRRSGDCTTLVADSSKARDEMGWEPQYPDLESIITSAWNWHQKYPDGYTVD